MDVDWIAIVPVVHVNDLWESSGIWGWFARMKIDQPLLLCFGSISCECGDVAKMSVMETDQNFSCDGQFSKIVCWWRLDSVPQMDLQAPLSTNWGHFSVIQWLHQLAVYVCGLEFGRW